MGIGKIGIFSDTMRSIVDMAEKFHHDRTIPVLIEGETGTGKEIIARLVHHGHGEETTPFISLNCSAIAPGLFESELFGYEGGAFSGSKTNGMMGKLEHASGGTLFLDEIGDLPLELQPKLLRVIQEREIYRVGGLKNIKLDVRIICATNRTMDTIVNNGLFRRDLYYRLNTGKIYIPPLQQRREEIAPLAQMFLEQYAEQKKRRFRLIQKKAIQILENHEWPGNVRELENAIERVVLLYDSVEITAHHLQFLNLDDDSEKESNDSNGSTLSLYLPPDSYSLESGEAEIIKKALSMFKGNKTRTAAYLRISLSTLKRKINKIA